MGVVTGIQLGKVLCEMLGIDAKLVTRITIVCDVKDIARVQINMLAARRKVPLIQLSNRVMMTDEARAEMNEWLLKMFGTMDEPIEATKHYKVMEVEA
jgi:hypothetical protein